MYGLFDLLHVILFSTRVCATLVYKGFSRLVVYLRATWCTFQPKPQKIKKIYREKKFLIFRERELSNSKIKKFLILSQKKAFLIFSQKIPLHVPVWAHKNLLWKNFLYFLKKAPNFLKWKPRKNPYVSGNRPFLYFGK